MGWLLSRQAVPLFRRQLRGRVDRDKGASGSRKCPEEMEPFHREDTGKMGVGKKRKLNPSGGQVQGHLSAVEN